MLSCFSLVRLCSAVDPARQAPVSMGFSRQEYLSALPCNPPASSQPRDQTYVSYVSCVGRRVLYLQCHLGSHSPEEEGADRKEGVLRAK